MRSKSSKEINPQPGWRVAAADADGFVIYDGTYSEGYDHFVHSNSARRPHTKQNNKTYAEKETERPVDTTGTDRQ